MKTNPFFLLCFQSNLSLVTKLIAPKTSQKTFFFLCKSATSNICLILRSITVKEKTTSKTFFSSLNHDFFPIHSLANHFQREVEFSRTTLTHISSLPIMAYLSFSTFVTTFVARSPPPNTFLESYKRKLIFFKLSSFFTLRNNNSVLLL